LVGPKFQVEWPLANFPGKPGIIDNPGEALEKFPQKKAKPWAKLEEM